MYVFGCQSLSLSQIPNDKRQWIFKRCDFETKKKTGI